MPRSMSSEGGGRHGERGRGRVLTIPGPATAAMHFSFDVYDLTDSLNEYGTEACFYLCGIPTGAKLLPKYGNKGAISARVFALPFGGSSVAFPRKVLRASRHSSIM